MLKRFLAVLTTVALAFGLALAAASPASAHTPYVTPTCSTLTVKLNSYGAGTTNTLTVTIDGSIVENTTFGDSFAQKTYSFSGTTSHTYVVEIDAQHNDHDRTVAKGNAFTGTTSPCTTAVCTNPLTSLNNFTIVTEGDLTVSNGGAHVEGTAAVGDDLVVNNQYHVQNNHDGTALPVVDGESTGLLVGDEVTINTGGEAFQVNAGATRIGDTAGAAITDGKRYRPVSAEDRFIRMAADATLSEVAAPGLFDATFPNLFSDLRDASDEIAAFDTGDVTFVTTSANGGDGQKVTLSAGVTNVLRVNATQLSAITKLWFDGGVNPSPTTPFIIDVTSAGNITTTAPVLMNIDERYVLWNFTATTLNLSTTEFIKGSILAPRAQLNLTSGGIEGQIAAKSMVITSVGEIHHIAYSPCATPPTAVAGAATSTAEYCDALYVVQQGSVTATAATGVTYQLWNAAKSVKLADLTADDAHPVDDGTYYVKVLPASGAYTVSEADTWIEVVVGAYTGDCTAPLSVTGAATATAEYCDSADHTVAQGAVTATAATGVTYELWNAAQDVKIDDLAAGTAYQVDGGTYFVKVLPASDAYEVLPDNTWIEVVVGDYTGICAEGVSGSATSAAEYCDTDDYEVGMGSVTANAATGVVYELWNATKTTKIADLTAGAAYLVDGGTYFVKVLPASSSYDVSPGNTWIEVVVGEFTGLCAEPVSGAATVSAAYCDADELAVQRGSVTAAVAAGVTYELWNATKTAKIADLVAGEAYSVDAGSYFVKVLPLSDDYTVSDSNTWIEAVVDADKTVCEVIGDPTMFEQCVVDAADPLISNWTAYLTIVAVDHVQYRVYVSNGITWVDQGIWAAGRHDAGTPELPYDSVVKVVAEPESGWSLLAPKDWTFDFAEEFDCNLPEHGIVEPTVVFAQTCEAGASYTLAIEGGVAGSVLWSVNGAAPTTQLGTFSVTEPSTVTIVATPAPGAGFDGDGLPRTFERTFAAPAGCDLETLALTGQTGFGQLVIAALLFQAGLALLAVQFMRSRRSARHVA